MAIKLFATDVDGTLLNNSRQISEGNKAKIRQAVKDGMIFTIATGRMHHSATPFVDDLKSVSQLYNSDNAMITDGENLYLLNQ